MVSPNFNQNQSAYCLGHTTETALLLLLDRIYLAADGSKSTMLVSLDLSAAFDTIDHDVLCKKLNHSFIVTGVAHSCLRKVSLFNLVFTPRQVMCQLGVI